MLVCRNSSSIHLPKEELIGPMLDYLDTFVHEYTTQKRGKEFPSLRITTDMLLTLINDLKNIDVSGLGDNAEDPADAIEELGKRLSDYREGLSKNIEETILDSRKLGLFLGEDDVKPLTKDEPELKPLKISSKADRDWLRKCGINYK